MEHSSLVEGSLVVKINLCELVAAVKNKGKSPPPRPLLLEMRINNTCEAFHLKTPLQQNTPLQVNRHMKGTRGGGTDHHEEFKSVICAVPAAAVLTAALLSCSHARRPLACHAQ